MTTAAAIAGPIIGGIFSERSASAGAAGQEAAADAIQKASQQARRDVISLFPAQQQALFTGAQGAFDIFGQSIPLQQQQLAAGNLNAQQSIAQGFSQAEKALLGLPTQDFQAASVEFSETPPFGGTELFGDPILFRGSGGEQAFLRPFTGLGEGTPEQQSQQAGFSPSGIPLGTTPPPGTNIFGIQNPDPAIAQQSLLARRFRGEFLPNTGG